MWPKLLHSGCQKIDLPLIHKCARTVYPRAFSRAYDKTAERTHVVLFFIRLTWNKCDLPEYMSFGYKPSTNKPTLKGKAAYTYRALFHACPHRIYIRFIFLYQKLKLSVFLLSSSVVALVSLNALAASRRISHVQATGQIVRTRKPVKQIQKRVGVTKRKIEIAQVPLGEAWAHGFRLGESQAVFGDAVRMTSFKSPQRFGRIAYKNKTLLSLMAGWKYMIRVLQPFVSRPRQFRLGAEPQMIREQNGDKQKRG